MEQPGPESGLDRLIVFHIARQRSTVFAVCTVEEGACVGWGAGGAILIDFKT
jgi:hypothetical protein